MRVCDSKRMVPGPACRPALRWCGCGRQLGAGTSADWLEPLPEHRALPPPASPSLPRALQPSISAPALLFITQKESWHVVIRQSKFLH